MEIDELKQEPIADVKTVDFPPLPSLEEQGIAKAYSEAVDWRCELKRLVRDVLSHFLQLLECLIHQPSHSACLELVDSIRVLFINIHHLINQQRPAQARTMLRDTVANKLQETKDLILKFRERIESGSCLLKDLHNRTITAPLQFEPSP
uniref:Mediator of RNA polymerase II transcription subunit 7 n=1 Tax=Ditylenchus dipsaci TaxID=166011 RepID=A0A915E3I5_9BILA